MKTIINKTNLFFLSCLCSLQSAWAQNKIPTPSNVKKVTPQELTNVGDDINGYLLAGIAISIVIAVGITAFLFFRGKSQEGGDMVMNVIIGVLIAVFGVGIAFGMFGS